MVIAIQPIFSMILRGINTDCGLPHQTKDFIKFLGIVIILFFGKVDCVPGMIKTDHQARLSDYIHDVGSGQVPSQ